MSRIQALILTTWTLGILGCEESLPPREEPSRFLEADLNAFSGVVVFRDSIPVTNAGSFFLTLKNIYDDVLQEEAFVQATINVALMDEPDQRAVVRADQNNLLNYWILRFNMVTLEPGTEAQFLKQWNHRTVDGIPFWEYVRLTQKFTDRGEPYLESEPMNFVAQGKVQIFKNVPPEPTRQIEFTLTYHIFD